MISGKNRFLRVTALAIIVVFAVVCLKRLDPYVENRAKYEAKNAVSGVMSAAAYSVFDEQSNSYDDFAAVIYDENGYKRVRAVILFLQRGGGGNIKICITQVLDSAFHYFRYGRNNRVCVR